MESPLEFMEQSGSLTPLSPSGLLDSGGGGLNGYQFLGSSDGYLYLGREDSVLLLNNFVRVKFGRCRISPTPEKVLEPSDAEANSNSYVTVRGTFEAPHPSTPLQFGGTICGITSVTPVEDPRNR
jgi:hypothetical protein